MRAFVRLIDASIRRTSGVFTFCEHEDCLFRLQFSKTRHELNLSGSLVPPGALVLELHLWNEHIPPFPPSGPDLTWAIKFRRMLNFSLRAVGELMKHDQRMSSVLVVGGRTSLLSLDRNSGDAVMLQHLGFTVSPYQNRLGRFGMFWDNLYAWWLIWTFNPRSLRSRRFSDLERIEFWMPAEDFISRYSHRGI